MTSAQDSKTPDPVYWPRYWRPLKSRIQDGDVGDGSVILADGRVTLREVADTPCLVLLGEPGMGKTTEIERFASQLLAAGALVDVVRGRDPQLSETLDRLLTSKHHALWASERRSWHVLIDGVDEVPVAASSVAQRFGAFFDRLLASAPNVSALHVMLTSRDAAWSSEMMRVIEQRWPLNSFQTLELLPLEADQVREAINHLGLETAEARDLGERLFSGSLAAISTRPLLLKLLLDLYLSSNTILPRQTDLVKLAVEGALQLTLDASSPETLDQLITVTGRMAAAATFSQQMRFTTVFGASAPDSVAMPQLAGGTEDSSLGPFVVTPQIMGRCLRSSLFRVVGPHTYEWSHRQFVEYLTARYLAEHRLSADQILSLLTVKEVGGPGGIAPQFRDIAGWTASMVPTLFDRLVAQEPDILLETDIAAAEPADRARLADALLGSFASGGLLDRYQQILPLLGRLSHPGLAGQLRPVIADRNAGAGLHRLAVDMAVANGLVELVPDLLAVARDEVFPTSSRAQTVRAVARLGDRESREALVPILSQDLAGDQDDNLRGAVLSSCWPEALAFRTLLTALTPPKQPDLLGAYGFFLYRFEPPALSGEMALDALSWLKLRLDLDDERHNRFLRVTALMFNAVAASTSIPAVRQAMADLIVSADIKLSRIAGTDRTTVDPWPASPDDRVALVVAVLEQSPDPSRATNALLYYLPGLIEPDNLDAYLRALPLAGAQPIATALADVVAQLSARRPIETLDAVWEAADQNPVLREFLCRHFTVDLDSLGAEQWRKRLVQQQEQEKHGQQLETAAGQRAALIANLLDRIEGDEPGLWWQLNLQLFYSASGQYQSEFEFRSDLTASPGWQLLDDQQRDRVRRSAARYLIQAPLEQTDWLGTNTSFRPAAAGLRALRLLFEAGPAALDALPSETWQAWAPVTIGVFDNDFYADRPTQQGLVYEAYRRAPEAVIATIKQIALDPRSEGLTRRVFDLLDEIIDPVLSALLRDLRADPGLRGNAAGSDILSFLVRVGDPVVTQEVLAALRTPAEALAGRSEADVAALSAAAADLTLEAPATTWLALLELRGRDGDFARSVWSDFATAWSFRRSTALEGLSEYALAQAYLDLEALLPERPPQTSGARVLGPPDFVEQLRNALLTQLIGTGTNASLEQLTRLELTLPNGRELLRWPIEQARRTVRAASARPRDPAEILAEISAMAGVLAEPESKQVPKEPAPMLIEEVTLDLEVPLPERAPHGPLPAEQRRSILAVIPEWSSARGGIATLNRELCAALAALGHKVTCLTLAPTGAEILQARTRGVGLVACPSSVGISGSQSFLLCAADDLPQRPDLVIGHDHITGSVARALASRFDAKYVHLLHTIPQENEGLKLPRTDRPRTALDGEEKMKRQVQLGMHSDLVVAVGPRILRNFRSAALDAKHVVMLLPGLDPALLANTPDVSLLHVNQCLLSGRMEDAGVKGAGLACDVMRAVATGRAWPIKERPQLVIRGFSKDKADAEFAAIGIFAEYSRYVQLRAFSTDAGELLDDYRRTALVVMPSIAEGFGLTGLEAISFGVPVIVSKESGLAEYLLDPDLNEGLDLTLVEACVGPVMEDDDANRDDWAAKAGAALADHAAAFARADRLRIALSTRLTWDKAARRLSAEFRAL